MAAKTTPTAESQASIKAAPAASEAEEVQVQTEVAAQEPAPAALEPEKPDIKSLWAQLPAEERQALVADEEWHRKALDKARDDAYSQLVQRQQREYERQAQANQDLQQTLHNLDEAADDRARAQAIHGYAMNVAYREREARAAEDAVYFQGVIQTVFGLNTAQFDVKWLDAQRAAAAEGRRADWSDLLKQVVGDKYMPKSEAGKLSREEISAMVEEAIGKRLAGQPAPVTLGPAEASPAGGISLESYLTMSPEAARQLTPEQRRQLDEQIVRRATRAS